MNPFVLFCLLCVVFKNDPTISSSNKNENKKHVNLSGLGLLTHSGPLPRLTSHGCKVSRFALARTIRCGCTMWAAVKWTSLPGNCSDLTQEAFQRFPQDCSGQKSFHIDCKASANRACKSVKEKETVLMAIYPGSSRMTERC